MNRNVAYGLLIGAIALVLALVGVLIWLLQARSADSSSLNSGAQKARTYVSLDPHAGRDQEAIDIVKTLRVISPEYIDAVEENKKSNKEIDVEFSRVTVDSLIEQQFLEKRFNMNSLKKGEWRTLHLDTDVAGSTQKPDPHYEVYLDYSDESVLVGPVWVVDVETQEVIPRNDMASVFDRNLSNYEAINDHLERPANVVRAIISHQFDSGIDLGGVFLLHFNKLISDPKHANDEIIGWTVMHDFKDDYVAYFQWRELGEVKAAKFLFNWETKSLQPVGLLAIDLMNMGENMSSVKPVNILPNDYINDLAIPRNERWGKNHKCRIRDYRNICTGFVKVLEQREFVNAMAWLVTNGEADATRRVERCKSEKNCSWVIKIASGDLNPSNNSNLILIEYKYLLNDRSQSVKFLVDAESETVKPLDQFSQWAYWIATPRT